MRRFLCGMRQVPLSIFLILSPSKDAMPFMQQSRKGASAARRSRASLTNMNSKDIDEFFRRLAAERPDPRSELQYINPFTLLVAVVLSAQATDVGVNKATEKLFTAADT